jgi:ribosomal protein S11
MTLIVHISLYRNNTFLTISNSTGKILFTTNAGSLGFKSIAKSGLEAHSSILSTAFKRIFILEGTSIFLKIAGTQERLLESLNKNFILALKKQNVIFIGYKFINTIPHNGCRLVKKK